MSNEQDAVQLAETKDFQRHLRRLARMGGPADTAHQQVIHALKAWARGEATSLPVSAVANRAVPHTVQYELKGGYRLVTYELAGMRVALMVGNAADVDAWLIANASRDFTVNHSTGRIRYTPVVADDATTKAVTQVLMPTGSACGAVLDRIPPILVDALQLPPETKDWLYRELTFERIDADDPDAWTTDVRGLKFPSDEHCNVMLQAVGLLAAGEDDEAVERVSLFVGNATTASSAPARFASGVASGDGGDFLVSLTGMEGVEVERLVGGGDMAEWMLFLHPEQRRLVERDYNGPARLIGVSGSGKTSVLVHRANALAKKYPGERILILTLNPALAQLLNHLADRLCGRSTRPQISVQTIYEYCYQAVKTIAPNRLIEKLDPKSGEDLAACWADFMEKPHAVQISQPIIDALDDRPGRMNAAAYLLDELVWIRGGFGRDARLAYETCERPGRGIELPRLEKGDGQQNRLVKGFPADTRRRILELLRAYEQYMREGGLMDEDGVSLEAFSVKGQIPTFRELRARCVLVDEVQDCSTVELEVIAQIPTHPANGLFLSGDPVQKVFAKQHDVARAGIDIKGRSSVLRTNYRNTRQILEAAYEILLKFRHMSPVPLADVLEPEYAFRDGPRPKLYECVSAQEQTDLVLWHLGVLPTDALDGACICSQSGASLDRIEAQVRARGFATYRVRGTSPRDAIVGPGVKLALIHDIKGFEFGSVFLIDLTDEYLLPEGMPWEERWRVAFQIYVAMTRARDQLTMSFVFNRSILLAPLGDTVDEGHASEVLGSE